MSPASLRQYLQFDLPTAGTKAQARYAFSLTEIPVLHRAGFGLQINAMGLSGLTKTR
jgi:hypothetical protein